MKSDRLIHTKLTGVYRLEGDEKKIQVRSKFHTFDYFPYMQDLNDIYVSGIETLTNVWSVVKSNFKWK